MFCRLKTATPLVALYLFDSSSNSTISEIANLLIIFSTGNCINLDFYITLLDSFCSLVLGYNWLTQHNPVINWVNGSINFHLSLWENLAPSHIMANTPLTSPSLLDIPLQLSDSAVFIPASETSMSNSEQPSITIIGAATFLCTSKLLSSSNFELYLCSLDIQANSAKLAEAPDLSNVPSEYHEFTEVFSKTKAEILTPHHPYDLKINLEEDAQPLVGPIYSLLVSEQETLLRKTSIWVSSNQSHLCIVHWSYSLRRKMVHYASVSTSVVLTISSKGFLSTPAHF